MRLKSYFAGTVEAAIASASRELGEDAMLVYSREAAPEARYLGRHEVVFAIPGGSAPPPQNPQAPAESPLATSHSSGRAEPVLEQMRDEMQTLRVQMAKLSARVASQKLPEARPAAGPSGCPHPVRDLVASLEAAFACSEVPPGLSRQIIDRWIALSAGVEPSQRRPLLANILGQFVAAGTGMSDSSEPEAGSSEECRVVALVGPPGVGKTTALVKMAAKSGLTARRPIQLITFDNYRVAGAEPLRTYAAILGVGFQSLETTPALSQALEEHRQKALVLIDTPGWTPRDEEDTRDFARFLHASPRIDVHLALSASMKSADVQRVADWYDRFRPNKLLFTRLDETSTLGPLWAEAVARNRPLSFFSDGQRIPEDFRQATPESVAELLLGSVWRDWETEPSINTATASGSVACLAGTTKPPGRLLEEPASETAAVAA